MMLGLYCGGKVVLHGCNPQKYREFLNAVL